MTSHFHRKFLGLMIGCVLLALGVSGTAAADSIVFVKKNDVWLANPDGSGQYQVTRDGTAENPYISPSQADDGTIVAGRELPNGGPLYRMKQNGSVINEIPVGSLMAGPFSPAVSPDGRTVAYEHVFSGAVNGYIETSSDVRFTKSDGSTPDGLGEVGRGAGDPSWIDSRRAFVGINAIATTVTPGQDPVEWWSDYDHQPRYFNFGQDVEDGEVATNGNIVVVRGEGQTSTVQLYKSAGGFTALPEPTCTLSGASPGPAGQEFKDPTFAPGGTELAWQEGDGIWSMKVPPDCTEGEPKLLIAGASEPDWGPADIHPGPRQAPGTEGPGQLKVGVASRALRSTLAKGIRLQLRVPGPGRLKGVARLGGKPVASGAHSVARGGPTRFALRFSRTGRHRLAGRDRVGLQVAVTFRPIKGAALTRKLRVGLKC